ncbi:MAG TPA: nickel-dependent hydrogenase large subunit [Rhodoblastus sp.]|nr:nickel-dependent hydrogenase large subunit [Rhodoblastus sp.]
MSVASTNLILRAHRRDGVVETVEILSPRADPSPLFVGLKPEQAALLAGRLFSLCPSSQSIAVEAACDAASGFEPDPAALHIGSLKLLCERLGEMLRASLLDWPRAAPPAPDDVAYLRAALRSLRALAEGQAAAPDLRAATDALGLGAERDEGSFFARQIAEAQADDACCALWPGPPDFLCADDDADVRAAMRDNPAFSRAPSLPGRCPETGASARRGGSAAAFAKRLAARLADMASTRDAIETLLAGGAAPGSLLDAQGGGGEGFAAVESARGRLYHAVRLDQTGRIVNYQIVAPTEWNFHPDGPFARALRGARIGAGEAAKQRIERLAFLFDPCIRASAEIRDDSDA